MSKKTRELAMVLDKFIIYDHKTHRYIIGSRDYHEKLVPRLKKLVEEKGDA